MDGIRLCCSINTVVACSHTVSSLAFARRSPKSCAAIGTVVRSGSVLKSVGRCSYTQQCTHTVTGSQRRIGETSHPLLARAYHALGAHWSQPSPKNTLQPKKRTTGEGAMQQPPLGRLLYTMMMLAAVLARMLIGTC